jgi:hypothetical protein
MITWERVFFDSLWGAQLGDWDPSWSWGTALLAEQSMIVLYSMIVSLSIPAILDKVLLPHDMGSQFAV